MTDPTAKAKDLLARATVEEPLKCECPGLVGYGWPTHNNPCVWFDTMHARGTARRKIGELGFTPDTLRVAIGLAEYAEERPESEHDGGCSAGISKLPCKCSQQYRADALAAWAALLEGMEETT